VPGRPGRSLLLDEQHGPERVATNRPVPPDLQRQVEAAFKEGTGLPWDVALARIVKNEVARKDHSAR
jgi:hypothetical protein